MEEENFKKYINYLEKQFCIEEEVTNCTLCGREVKLKRNRINECECGHQIPWIVVYGLYLNLTIPKQNDFEVCKYRSLYKKINNKSMRMGFITDVIEIENAYKLELSPNFELEVLDHFFDGEKISLGSFEIR